MGTCSSATSPLGYLQQIAIAFLCIHLQVRMTGTAKDGAEISIGTEMARILVVEDEVMLRYSLAMRLRMAGHDVLEASSADEAQTMLSSILAIDLVVTDVKMPGSLDGLQLTRSIRATQPRMPVIVVSGTTLDAEAKSAGATTFFRKPYDFEKIAMCVAELVPQHVRPDDQSANRGNQ
jgi:CheY-like chemotaxis protein